MKSLHDLKTKLLAKKLVFYVSLIHDPFLREFAIRDLCEFLDMPEEILSKELDNILRGRIIEEQKEKLRCAIIEQQKGTL